MGIKKFIQGMQRDVQQEYERRDSQLPAGLGEQDLQILQNEIQSFQADIARALSPQDLNNLPEALRNDKFLDGLTFRMGTKRTTKNINTGTEKINAIRNYTDALQNLLQSRGGLLQEQLRARTLALKVKLEIATDGLRAEAEYLKQQQLVDKLKSGDAAAQKKQISANKLILARYRSRLLHVKYDDMEGLEQLVQEDGIEPRDLEAAIQDILNTAPIKQQPTTPKKEPLSEVERFREKVSQYKNKYKIYDEIRKEYQNNPELAEKIIKELEADAKRERLNRQE